MDRNALILRSGFLLTEEDRKILDSSCIRGNVLPDHKFEWIYKWLSLVLMFIENEKL